MISSLIWQVSPTIVLAWYSTLRFAITWRGGRLFKPYFLLPVLVLPTVFSLDTGRFALVFEVFCPGGFWQAWMPLALAFTPMVRAFESLEGRSSACV